jgi:hypothetical protein
MLIFFAIVPKNKLCHYIIFENEYVWENATRGAIVLHCIYSTIQSVLQGKETI